MKRKRTLYRIEAADYFVFDRFVLQRKRAWFGLWYGKWRTITHKGVYGWPCRKSATTALLDLLQRR